MPDREKILREAEENLDRGRAIATGIGVFVVIIRGERNADGDFREVLLRRRSEKDSLYGRDLSGKWEMTGGGVELAHLGSLTDYQGHAFRALQQELQEEAGLKFRYLPSSLIGFIQAWSHNEEKGILDIAMAMPLRWESMEEIPEFQEKLKTGEIRFIRIQDLGRIEIISQRTRFLINAAIDAR